MKFTKTIITTLSAVFACGFLHASVDQNRIVGSISRPNEDRLDQKANDKGRLAEKDKNKDSKDRSPKEKDNNKDAKGKK